jgi:hypothetical protein
MGGVETKVSSVELPGILFVPSVLSIILDAAIFQRAGHKKAAGVVRRLID